MKSNIKELLAKLTDRYEAKQENPVSGRKKGKGKGLNSLGLKGTEKCSNLYDKAKSLREKRKKGKKVKEFA